MRNRQKILEQLKHTPEDWRFVKCTQKKALGNKYTKDTTFTLEEVLEKDGDGVGVLLGRHSLTTINGKKYGLGAIDFDGTNSDLSFEHYMGFSPYKLPNTVVDKSGKEDRCQMFYWIPEEYLDVLEAKEKGYKDYAKFELRIHNQYSMVAGAHPETDGYFWFNSPADMDVAIAPLLLLEGWEELSKDQQKDRKTEFIKKKKTEDDLKYDSARVKRYLKKYFVPVND